MIRRESKKNDSEGKVSVKSGRRNPRRIEKPCNRNDGFLKARMKERAGKGIPFAESRR